MSKEEEEQLFKKFGEIEGFSVKDHLGKGGYGSVIEIIMKKDNKVFAAKLLDKDKIEKEAQKINGFKGPGITKIIKVSQWNNRYLIIMEKSALRDLDYFIYNLHKKNILYFIFYPFEIVGNNLLRFFIKKILKGMEVLNRYNYSHFDIKPQNILIFSKMITKLVDFSVLSNIAVLKENQSSNKYNVPFGTHGYVPPEIYQYR